MTDKDETPTTTKFKGIGEWRSQARKLEREKEEEPKDE